MERIFGELTTRSGRNRLMVPDANAKWNFAKGSDLIVLEIVPGGVLIGNDV